MLADSVITFPAMAVIVEPAVMLVPLTPIPTARPVLFGTVMVAEVAGTLATVWTNNGVRATVPPPLRITLTAVAPLLTMGELMVATPVLNEFTYSEEVPEVSEPP